MVSMEREARLFEQASIELVRSKLAVAGVSDRVELVPGYFGETLPAFASERFSFVHLDCDLYEPYKECLAFFYPRLSPGGIVLFDEYHDPVYRGCDRVVDEYLGDREESLEEICRDNQIKFYFQKR